MTMSSHLGTIAAAALLALGLGATAAQAADEPAPSRVQITDPYIELHTGAGRGYPVFHVTERTQWIEITLRRTDWYKVRTADGKEGWVHRSQLASTLGEDGNTTTFRDPTLADYLQRRGDAGFALGRFKGEPMLKVWAGWKLAEVVAIEGTVGQVQGVFSGSSLWHVGLNAEPWADQRLAPFLGVGVGSFRNVPNRSLVSAVDTNARLAHATAGVRWHVSNRFVVRADYTLYNAFVSDNRSTEYRAVTAGVSFFF